MSRDLRKYARQTNLRLIAGALLLIFIVGDGLIYLIYGGEAAIAGLLCLLAGLIPVILTVFVLICMDWISRHAQKD